MIRSLQIGRGLAAFAVCAYHLSIMFADPRFGKQQVLSNFTAYGYLGVDFFFVLSGFIILMAHERDINRPSRLWEFLIKRFIRVYPLYWIFTGIIIVGSAATGGVNGYPTQFGDWASIITLFHWSNYDPPLNPSWTLYYEIIFYVLFGALIFNRWLGAAVLALWFGLVLILWQLPPHDDRSIFNTLISVFNLSFLCGIGAFWLARHLGRRLSAPAIVLGIGVLATTYLVETYAQPVFALRPLYGVGFMSLLAGCVSLERYGWKPNAAGLLALGNASYALYLSHESVGSTAFKILIKLGIFQRVDHRILYFAILAGMVVFALLFYRFVEEPMLRALRQVVKVKRSAPEPKLASTPIVEA